MGTGLPMDLAAHPKNPHWPTLERLHKFQYNHRLEMELYANSILGEVLGVHCTKNP